MAGDTDLCAHQDPGFESWLQRVRSRRIAPRASACPSMVHLTRAVRSREYQVSLVACEKALLRVFVTAAQATTAGIPSVRFYLKGTERYAADIPAKTMTIAAEVLESSLSQSANVEIPGKIVQPGLEMVVEIDSEGTLDRSLGVTRRTPEMSRVTVDVREMPAFDHTVNSFRWSAGSDRLVVEAAEGM